MTSIGTQTIVVGIDGSANSDAALDWAVEAAALQGLQLHLFSAGVHGSDDEDPDSDGYVDAQIARQALATAAEHLSRATQRVAERSPDLVVTTRSGLEPAVRSLVAYSLEAHSIVLGRSGHNAWTGALLGAVASKVVNQARCPVAVVHAPTRATAPAQGVAVAIDGSPMSEIVLAHAFHHASLRGLDLNVIHASWTRAGTRTPDTRTDQVNQEQLLVSEALVGWAERYPDVTVRVSLPVGPTVLAIIEEARAAQLLVMGCRRTGLPRVLLGSVSRGVLKHAPCTVLIVRDRVDHPGPSVTFGSADESLLATR